MDLQLKTIHTYTTGDLNINPAALTIAADSHGDAEPLRTLNYTASMTEMIVLSLT